MADLALTPANVLAGTNATIKHGVAGIAVTAGKVVYYSSPTKQWLLADNDLANAKSPGGICLHAAAAGQPLDVQTMGDITIGATLTPGTAYYLSATAGGICPVADLTTGDNVSQLGLAKSTTVLALDIQVTNVTL